MIRVENLSKQFKVSQKQRKLLQEKRLGNKINAVSGVSFECKPGRVFSLLGANGAGKTTTLRMIATMLKPTSGTIDFVLLAEVYASLIVLAGLSLFAATRFFSMESVIFRG